jgi:hypothetical protein
MKFEDAPISTLLVMRERMQEEVRLTYYVRVEGESHLPNFITALRVATVQGEPWRGR